MNKIKQFVQKEYERMDRDIARIFTTGEEYYPHEQIVAIAIKDMLFSILKEINNIEISESEEQIPKPLLTIKDCVAELVYYIEETGNICYEQDVKAKARMLDLLRTELLAYRKLKDWIEKGGEENEN